MAVCTKAEICFSLKLHNATTWSVVKNDGPYPLFCVYSPQWDAYSNALPNVKIRYFRTEILIHAPLNQKWDFWGQIHHVADFVKYEYNRYLVFCRWRLVESDGHWSGINLLNFRRNVLHLVQGMSLLLSETYQSLSRLKHIYLKRDSKSCRNIRFGYS
jgi:hypothetical protein